jgi:predicted RNA polymerase sigma factor
MLSALDVIRGLDNSHLWHAARADALAKLGRDEEASRELRVAISLSPTTPERALLTARLDALTGDG